MMRIPILYEDNHLLVVAKPPGIPSQGDESGDLDMLTLLKLDLKERYNKPGNVFLGLVHRLDRPVGGAMVFAKTSKGASRLSEAVRSRHFGKTYMCIAQGKPAVSEADLIHYIRKDQKRNQVAVFDKPAPDAKDARLSYRIVAADEERSLIAVKLHTGRPHQIRAQLAHIGCPLVGDMKYGDCRGAASSHIALWSTSLSFPHPVTKEQVTFHSVPDSTGIWSRYTNEQLEAAAACYTGDDDIPIHKKGRYL
ncbi:RluA family pseudouridine synthase [Paenibacillus chungangensis]|uniref:RNA pseudouridylate synthase n=1 Tax=Paenibacillus chungangensis TaxID=696535 RepID=A0ABW3HN07_9BACL